jgi:hypothetical protein
MTCNASYPVSIVKMNLLFKEILLCLERNRVDSTRKKATTKILTPFMLESGPIGAFTAPHGDPATDEAIIQYVSTFVPKMSGQNFNPHVSTGVAPKEYLDKMLVEPFEPFSFSPAGAAVYQLGPFGTAAKKLKGWNLKP